MNYNLMAVSAGLLENETLVGILLGVDTAILALLLVCLIWWIIWRIAHRKKVNEEVADNSADGTLVPDGMMLLPVDYGSATEKVFVPVEEKTEKEPVSEEPDLSGEDTLTLKKVERKQLADVYLELSPEQKGFFDRLLAYAMSKEGAIENRTKTEIQVKIDRKQVVRLAIKRGITVAKYHLENPLMKQYRRKDAETKISIKDTEIKIVDVAAYETAKGLVDVAIENNRREREAEAEARRRRRSEAKKKAVKEE